MLPVVAVQVVASRRDTEPIRRTSPRLLLVLVAILLTPAPAQQYRTENYDRRHPTYNPYDDRHHPRDEGPHHPRNDRHHPTHDRQRPTNDRHPPTNDRYHPTVCFIECCNWDSSCTAATNIRCNCSSKYNQVRKLNTRTCRFPPN